MQVADSASSGGFQSWIHYHGRSGRTTDPLGGILRGRKMGTMNRQSGIHCGRVRSNLTRQVVSRQSGTVNQAAKTRLKPSSMEMRRKSSSRVRLRPTCTAALPPPSRWRGGEPVVFQSSHCLDNGFIVKYSCLTGFDCSSAVLLLTSGTQHGKH